MAAAAAGAAGEPPRFGENGEDVTNHGLLKSMLQVVLVFEVAFAVGTDGYCSPRHREPFNAISHTR